MLGRPARRPQRRRLDRGINANDAAGWARARDVVIAILGSLVIIGAVLWGLALVTTALLVLILGALLAYVLAPAVAILSRHMPRWLAISIMYLIMLALLSTVGYLIVNTAISQISGLSKTLPTLLTPAKPNGPSPLYHVLHQLGISDQQIKQGRQAVLNYLEGAATNVPAKALPLLTGVAGALVDAVLVFVISIYLVIDGPRLVRWLREQSPVSQRERVLFALDVLDSNVGGYVRGELILATLIGVLVGVGMFAFRVPYALLLGLLAFVLEFIPILGVLISGAVSVLVALTQGFAIAGGVFVYFVVVHIIEGDVVGPRVIGHVLGLHPVVAILALVAGAEIYGFWGAVFAAPVAGVIQSLVVAIWTEWRDTHPGEFPRPPMRARRNQQPHDQQPHDQQPHDQQPHDQQPHDQQQPVSTSSG